MIELFLSPTTLVLFGIGILTGAISVTFGIGGGMVTIPLLIMFFKFNGFEATATSLGVIVFTTLAGSIAYFREHKIDIKLTLVFILYSIPGSIAGSFLSKFLTKTTFKVDIFQLLFACIMILIAGFKIFMVLFKKDTVKKNVILVDIDESIPWWRQKVLPRSIVCKRGEVFNFNARVYPGSIGAFFGGFIGALLGLGGGVVYIPVLTLLLNIPIGIAAAISTVTIFFVNLIPVTVRYSSINWYFVLCMSAGTVLAATLVPRFLHKIKSEILLTIFWGIIILTGGRLLIRVFFSV